MKLHPTLIAAAVASALAFAPSIALAQAPAAAPAAKAKPAAQKSFASPDEAAAALIAALKARDMDGAIAIVGPGSRSWLSSGDSVADANDIAKVVAAYDEKKSVRVEGGKATLEVGNDEWPFPAPIVKKGSGWVFDANAGREEIINRRIGRNELDAIQTLLAIVDAQREYAATDADGNGYADYARRFRSTEGKKDGLYWPSSGGAPTSPLGLLVAAAAAEGYGKKAAPSKEPNSYHGYQYRIITAQGKNAPGGAYDYMVGDKLLGGFAIVAWPTSYRNSGVVTFVVNHEGVVYEKDLGANTAATATAMGRFDPDASWRKSQ